MKKLVLFILILFSSTAFAQLMQVERVERFDAELLYKAMNVEQGKCNYKKVLPALTCTVKSEAEKSIYTCTFKKQATVDEKRETFENIYDYLTDEESPVFYVNSEHYDIKVIEDVGIKVTEIEVHNITLREIILTENGAVFRDYEWSLLGL